MIQVTTKIEKSPYGGKQMVATATVNKLVVATSYAEGTRYADRQRIEQDVRREAERLQRRDLVGQASTTAETRLLTQRLA